MIHLDLFSGIGGFAYVVDRVWKNAKHIFVENDRFCQKVLRKHWPKSEINGDIKKFILDISICKERLRYKEESSNGYSGIFILTGGFPCQPFSQAGQRGGTQDNRYLWPEMFKVIQLTKPTWIIAENVRGLLTIEQGMVFEQVCFDLESEGYEIQTFIIPACAVNAPHRRDRIWIIANRPSEGLEGRKLQQATWIRSNKFRNKDSYASNTESNGRSQPQENERREVNNNRSWNESWIEVATEFCRVDAGFPTKLDGFELSKSGHRRERLKALGNAIVPQVAEQIMFAIKYTCDIKEALCLKKKYQQQKQRFTRIKDQDCYHLSEEYGYFQVGNGFQYQ